MKKLIFVILIACNSICQAQNCPPHAGNVSNKIDYDCALDLMSNFLAYVPLRTVAHDFSFGGYIPNIHVMSILGDEMKKKTLLAVPQPAYRLYPCYQKDAAAGLKVFMAYDAMQQDIDPDNFRACYYAGGAVELKKSTNNFYYREAKYDRAAVKAFIETNPFTIGDPVTTIPYATLQPYAIDFLSLYSVNGQPSGKFICGGFSDLDLYDLLTQPGAVGFRFFFGYDPGVTNEIRIILIAVDNQGKNIYKIGANEALFLEHSWPPF